VRGAEVRGTEATATTLTPALSLEGRGGLRYPPSPLWGEGRVRGWKVRGWKARGREEVSAVRESPRDYTRGLRRRQTDAERRLWARLRDRRLLGAKFVRQEPIGPYVVDFCCRELKLIVELDGGQHALCVAYDAGRTDFLEQLGYRVEGGG
jgi:very-short-patch-repair endonuclease